MYSQQPTAQVKLCPFKAEDEKGLLPQAAQPCVVFENTSEASAGFSLPRICAQKFQTLGHLIHADHDEDTAALGYFSCRFLIVSCRVSPLHSRQQNSKKCRYKPLPLQPLSTLAISRCPW